MTQIFKNASEHSTPQTRYIFPLPARSAVCAFEMWTDDGRHIRGVAKERKQAAREHKQAIKTGKLTSLVEWSTDDSMFFEDLRDLVVYTDASTSVFSISLGPIPGDQRISTVITVSNLVKENLIEADSPLS